MTNVQRDDLVVERDTRLRPWSVALAVLGPVLAVVALFILIGFDLNSSFGDPADANEYLQVWVLAIVLGGLVPMVGAVVLAVVCIVRRSPSFVGALVGGGAGLLLTALLAPALFATRIPDAQEYRAALDRTTAAERQDPESMRDELEQVHADAVATLPEAPPSGYAPEPGGESSDEMSWLRGDICDLSVGHDGVDWSSVNLESYEVDDVQDAIDAIREDAEAHGRSVEVETDDDTGGVAQLVVSTRSGDLYVDVESPVPPPGHEASTLRLDVVTHCVVG
jgi:hypothetical protein